MDEKLDKSCVLGSCGKGFVSRGGWRGGLSEKLPEASPRSNRANASQLQDGLTAREG